MGFGDEKGGLGDGEWGFRVGGCGGLRWIEGMGGG